MEIKWTRKLNSSEELFERANKANFLIVRQTLHLSSKISLHENEIKSALIHLQRKVPVMRLCIRVDEDKQLWFCELKNHRLDFEFVEWCNYQEEYETIHYRAFDSFNGPIWRSRFFKCPVIKNCDIMEAQKEYQYRLIFAFHHSIVDGTTSIKICSEFLDILNDVVAGNHIDDSKQLGFLSSYQDDEDILNEVVNDLSNRKNRFDTLQKLYEEVENINIELPYIFPSTTRIPKIETIDKILTVDKTKVLLKKCKCEGVTINSALCTAINVSIVILLLNAGIKREVYKIPFQVIVQLRRYWKETNSLGSAIYLHTLISKMKLDDIKNFWEYARMFNNEMKEYLRHKGPYEEMVTKKLMKWTGSEKLFTDDLNEIMNYNYMASNLGNLSLKEGEHVQITQLSISTSLRKRISLHEFLTFRGKLFYSLDYGVEYLSREGAQLWCDTIFDVLDQVI